jgi:RNA polymerase sigma factor (sigma-70 family)
MTRPINAVFRHWLHSLGGQTMADLPDSQLLQRFIHERDESAFALLMQRHGPLVLGVCRRLLHDLHDIEDAFQATFLVLACRAASVRRRDSLASFLYGTAYRIARRLRSQKAQRQAVECWAATERHEATLAVPESETYALLHEELNHLPRKYREVLVLCYLQSKTNEQAARELGYPPGSMSRHLGRARELLRERLLRRGLGPLSALLAAGVAEQASAAVSPALLHGTLDTIRRHALASALLAGATPPAAVRLAQGVLRAAWLTRLTLASIVLAVGVVFAAGVAALQTPAEKATSAEAKAPATPPDAKPQPRLDLHGDPLPDGVLARMGTERLRHPHAIRLHFMADGKTLLSVGQDQTVRFWDLATGKLQRLQRLPQSQKAMALSADGKTVALTSEEHLHLWDIASAKEIRRIPTGNLANEKQLNWVEFSPDGKMLAAGNYDSTVFLWDVASGKERAHFKHKDNFIRNLAFSADGKMLAALGDQHILLWDVASGKELQDIEGRNSFYSRLIFSPDGKLLVESSTNAIRLCDVATGKRLKDIEFDRAYDEYVLNNTSTFAPEGKTLAIDLGHSLVLWNLATRKEVKRLEVNRSGIWHGSDWMCFSPDGKLLASTTSGKITEWDISNGKQLHEFSSHFYSADAVTISPDGKYVASACGGDRTVRLWDAHTGKALHVWLMPHRRIFPVLFTPDSANVIASSHSVSGDIRMWDVASGKERRIFRLPDLPKNAADSITGLRLSSDGKRLTAMSLRSETKDNKTYVRKRCLTTWDVASGERMERRPLTADDRIIMHTEQLSPDGKYATFFRPPSVILFDLLADRSVRSLPAADFGPIVFSADSKLLAYAEKYVGQIQRVRVYDLTSGSDVLTLETGRVELRNFSPDCRYLLTVGNSGLRLWELATGKEVLHHPNLTNLSYFDSCLAVAADGRSAAVGMPDTNILVWDLAPATRQKIKLSATDLDHLWSDLAGDDAPRAYHAIGMLIADSERAVPFLRNRLQPIKENAERIRRLLADLDSEQFAVRDAAYQELEKMDDAAHAVLSQELPKANSVELRCRIQSLLSVPWVVRSPEKLRQIRAITVLEQIGDAEARRLLERLAGGAAEARQTREARSALQHLNKRH